MRLNESDWDKQIAALPFGVVLHGERGAVLAANASAATLLGLTAEHLRTGSRPPQWRLHDDTGAAVPAMADLSAQVTRAGSGMTMPLVVTVQGAAIRRLWADLVPDRERLLLILRPVSAEPARAAGLLDPVTGLPHRALLFDRIGQSLARARVHGGQTTLVLADVRGLRAVNQAHGFECGDELLAVLGTRLRAGMRADHTVARYTGGTFAVVAEHARGTGAAVAESVRELAQGRVLVGGGVLRPRLRIGWASSGGDATVHQMVCAAEDRLSH
ncbi:GGDEF domain-containing protein [Actinokineospora iranica]|uniref:Diguanylate cyclase (GGDEF) domain-containing protein n=1 Tax=Actinokineospora iranica TaxID=1271860 RepID=A0A1G6PN91_9PSEU|nr:GGDEF domain-containing protein [Actinokineospora iranica]SDC81104.1 diguanylate cyclase (GGDEF) domain-containing protein [Actinokineospora iranica]